MSGLVVRPEEPDEHGAVHAVNVAAFGSEGEADLVDVLRVACPDALSVVAVRSDAVVGHVMFSPMTLDDGGDVRIAGLGPMAVAPGEQRRGIGTRLGSIAVELARVAGWEALIVLGHPPFYPRFGFVPASRFDLRSTYDVRDDVFMAMELVPGALANASGTVRYHPAFAAVDG